MTSNQLKIAGTLLIGYWLVRRFQHKWNDTTANVDNLFALGGVGVLIYGVMK
jgi:vacuolar-type H+-ATPase subunit I/STV1